MSLIQAIGKQKQVWISMFKASLVYSVNSRTVGDTEKPCLQKREEKKFLQINT